MNDCHAVLLDTVSIQNYIFSSTKLRENLGASHLVKEIYRKYLAWALSRITGRTFDLDAWKEAESETPDGSKAGEIGYIGGGKALLFFQDEKLAQRFIEEWSKILLVHTPGLTTAVACSPFPKEPAKFTKRLKMLFTKLEQNKAEHSPITALLRHGITAECARSGASAEIYNALVEAYVSAGTNARIEAASSSKKELEESYQDKLSDQFCFSDELEELGSLHGEDSHIAIVHIDGNEIGERFKRAPTLRAIRQLSKTVHSATEEAFDAVVTTAVERYDEIMQSLGFDPDSDDLERWYPTDGFKITNTTLGLLAKEQDIPANLPNKLRALKNQKAKNKKDFLDAVAKTIGSNQTFAYKRQILKHATKKKILPIRPIILGGDDVTFVCDGKLGIYFAKIFIEAFQQGKASDGKELTACAGVAITQTKYPFYRGVELAYELCANAKAIRKGKNEERPASLEYSFLDFHISLGGIAGKLKELRKSYSQGQQHSLLYRPFKIVPKEPFDEYSLDLFLDKIWQLQYSEDGEINLPNNRINELREVLTLHEEATRRFVQELKYRGRRLPEIEGHQYAETLFENRLTPYFDMIEILRFYPEFALREGTAGKGGVKL